MDLRKIRKLIEIFEVSNLSEIEIQEGEESIRLTRNLTVVAEGGASQVIAVSKDASEAVSEVDIDDASLEDEGTITVHSPMVGTFFASASPTDEPFVSVGEVSPGQPLCLIEAMKIFNQIEAEHSGTIVKILKENGDPVEYGEPLFQMSE